MKWTESDWKKISSENLENWKAEDVYSSMLFTNCISEFGCPELPNLTGYDKNYMERTLITSGCVVTFREEETGKVTTLKAYPLGYPMLHGDWKEYQAIGENGVTFILKREDIAVCWDNVLRIPYTRLIIDTFSERIADAQRTCDVRFLHHKAPFIFKGDSKFMANVKLFMDKLRKNVDHFVLDKAGLNGLSTNEIKQFDAPFINNDIQLYIQKLLMQFLNMRGINYNPETGKKERLVESETHANDEAIKVNRNSFLLPRQQWLEECKEKFPEIFPDHLEYKYLLKEDDSDVLDSERNADVAAS